MTWLTVTEYLCLTNDHGYVAFVVITIIILSSFMTYHRVCNKRNMMVATCGAGTAYHTVAHLFSVLCILFHSFLWGGGGVVGRVSESLVLCVMFCRSLSVLFLFTIVLSVQLRLTTSD